MYTHTHTHTQAFADTNVNIVTEPTGVTSRTFFLFTRLSSFHLPVPRFPKAEQFLCVGDRFDREFQKNMFDGTENENEWMQIGGIQVRYSSVWVKTKPF